ncbi:hypothetical protein F-liban_253 [Faustovirus]|nr:hypothetical protein F-liban_253 [Faustovirus]
MNNSIVDSIEILLSRCGLPHDAIGEIRKWLTPCWRCRKGKLTVHLLNSITYYHGNPLRERVAFRSAREMPPFVFLSKSHNVHIMHRDKKYICRDCRDNAVEYAQSASYWGTPFYKKLDHRIITFTLLDKRLHDGFMGVLQQYHPDKLHLYIARWRWFTGGSKSLLKKRKYWSS